MNKLEIEIPNDKEVDWEASAKQKQIVLKNKQLTYEDVCKKLFKNGYWYAYAYEILGNGINMDMADSPLNASTKHQLECILAKNKLANVARYLNGDWKYTVYDEGYIIGYNALKSFYYVVKVSKSTELSNVLFKTYELAKQAIEILGKDTIRLALEPLY